MRRVGGILMLVALLAAGCGSGGDVEELQQQVADLQRQVQGVIDGVRDTLGGLIP